MLDNNLLQALRTRKRYDTLYSYVPLESFSQDTRRMLEYFGLYFKSYPEHGIVQSDTLETLVKLKCKPSTEQLAIFKQLLKSLDVPVTQEVITQTIAQLNELRYEGKLRILLQRYKDGEEVDLLTEVHTLTQGVRSQTDVYGDAPWADGDVWEYIQAEADDAGYILDFLPEAIPENVKGITSGKNIGVAMPTDKGKTSLFCAAAVSFAKQHKEFLKTGYEKEFRPLLYLVNEGTAESITPRIYQTALGITNEQLFDLGKRVGGQGIVDEYVKVVGRKDAIRLVNIHGWTTSQVATLIEKHNPFCVMTDMTGRIRSVGSQGANDVQQLETVWDTMRQFTAIYGMFHIGSIQISAEGFDLLFPPLSACQNSKTGIQTTLDLAIWGGAYAQPDSNQEFLRGISTPKNKLKRSGKKSYIKAETTFNPDLNTWK